MPHPKISRSQRCIRPLGGFGRTSDILPMAPQPNRSSRSDWKDNDSYRCEFVPACRKPFGVRCTHIVTSQRGVGIAAEAVVEDGEQPHRKKAEKDKGSCANAG